MLCPWLLKRDPKTTTMQNISTHVIFKRISKLQTRFAKDSRILRILTIGGSKRHAKKNQLCLISPQPVSMPSSSSRFISTRTCTVVVLLPRISCTSESLGSVWSWESKPFVTPSWIWLKSCTPSDPSRLFSGRGRLSVGEPSTKRIYKKRKTFNKK